MNNIKESRVARLTGESQRYNTLSRMTRALLRRYKERYDVEGCPNANDLRAAFRALKKLRSKSIS